MENSQDSTNKKKEYNNLNWKSFSVVFFNILISALLAFCFIITRQKLDTKKNYYSVYWKNSDSTVVKSGPIWFTYDCQYDSLKSLKRITDTDKLILLNLAEVKKEGCDSFNAAIDELVFKSNYQNKDAYYLALILTAICGCIGVQLRTINNFIGVACFKKDFNFDLFWPWYVLRPFLGALIGPILFLMIDGKLYNNFNSGDDSQSLVIAITILAGFGSEDFLDLLRKLSKRFFGTMSSENNAKSTGKSDTNK